MNIFIDTTLIALIAQCIFILIGLTYLIPKAFNQLRNIYSLLDTKVASKRNAGKTDDELFEERIKKDIEELQSFIPSAPPESFDDYLETAGTVTTSEFVSDGPVEFSTDAQEMRRERKYGI